MNLISLSNQGRLEQMDDRFFKVNYSWFDDLSCEAAVVYGYIVNSLKGNRLYKADPETGELYYRISNSFIANGLYLSSFKIKSVLEELEDSGYIDVLMVRKPNQRCRYLKCNDLNNKVVMDIFYDLINEQHDLIKGTILSYIVFKLNVGNNQYFDMEDMLSLIGGDWNDAQISRAEQFLRLNDYINDNDEYTDKAIELAGEYQFSWWFYE